MQQPLLPKEITLEDGAIIIMWDDGHRSPYPHRFLRLRCPCANCVDEMTGNPRLDPDKVPQDVKAIDNMPVGNYAAQFMDRRPLHRSLHLSVLAVDLHVSPVQRRPV